MMTDLSFPNSMRKITGHDGKHVTIIMRTRDRPILLARALASVLSQTHTDWHLYVVNDNGDPAVVDALTGTYAPAFSGRLTVIHRTVSEGMEAASNAALGCSTSGFVAVHDDDDSWHPEFLETTTAFLNDRANDRYAAVVTHWVDVFERIVDDTCIEESRTPGRLRTNFISFATLLQQNLFPPISLLVRRSVVDEVGEFNASLPVLGDWDYSIRILCVGDIAVISREFAYYHHRARNQDAYGNTVISLIDQHKLYDCLYGNSIFRHLTQTAPGHVELMRAIACMLRQHPDGPERFAEVNASISALASTVERMNMTIDQIAMTSRSIAQGLRPLRWVWRKILPLRQCVARMRGRT